MVIAVLVLAVLGLWTPIAVALGLAIRWDDSRHRDEPPEASSSPFGPVSIELTHKRMRLECTNCGNHSFVELHDR